MPRFKGGDIAVVMTTEYYNIPKGSVVSIVGHAGAALTGVHAGKEVVEVCLLATGYRLYLYEKDLELYNNINTIIIDPVKPKAEATATIPPLCKDKNFVDKEKIWEAVQAIAGGKS